MANRVVIKPTTNDILSAEEIRILEPALKDVRRQGFGLVELLIRNGYIYNIKVTLEYHNGSKGK